MAKGKRKAIKAPAPALPVVAPAPIVDARPVDAVLPFAVSPVAAPDEPRYSFPWPSRCPRCGSLDTERTGTAENIQYRRCRAAVCRHSYKVMGDRA